MACSSRPLRRLLFDLDTSRVMTAALSEEGCLEARVTLARQVQACTSGAYLLLGRLTTMSAVAMTLMFADPVLLDL